MRQLPLSVRLHDRARFENFWPGPNEFVVAELRALAQQPTLAQPVRAGPPRAGLGSVGLTWLCGPVGTGKTHLLQALCAAAGQYESADPDGRAAYVPLSELKEFGATALQEWAGARWVCLDDVASVAGDIEWERALFAMYRDCEERGARLALAARETPVQLNWVLPDLASRCAAGVRLRLRALDEAEQCQALRWRAQQRGFDLPEETARYMQRRLPRDMASLFTVLDELDTAALVAQRRLTVPFIRDVLARALGQ